MGSSETPRENVSWRGVCCALSRAAGSAAQLLPGQLVHSLWHGLHQAASLWLIQAVVAMVLAVHLGDVQLAMIP